MMLSKLNADNFLKSLKGTILPFPKAFRPILKDWSIVITSDYQCQLSVLNILDLYFDLAIFKQNQKTMQKSLNVQFLSGCKSNFLQKFAFNLEKC